MINGDTEIVNVIISQLKDVNVVNFKLHEEKDKKPRKKREQSNIIKGSIEFIALLKETEFNKPHLINDLLKQIDYDTKSFNRLWKDAKEMYTNTEKEVADNIKDLISKLDKQYQKQTKEQ